MANKTSSLVFVLAFFYPLLAFEHAAGAQDLSAIALNAAKERGGGGVPLITHDGKLGAAQVQRLHLKLAAGQCVVAVAASGETTDLELTVRTPQGLSLGDGEPGPVARLRYCAGERDEQAQLRVRADKATGYALGVWAVQHGAGVVVPAAAPITAKLPATLPQQLALAAQAHAKGLQAMTVPREEDLGTGDARLRDVPLDAGRCYRFLAVAEAKLQGVKLALQDGKGTALIADQRGELESVLGEDAPFCPAAAANYKLAISVSAGAGRVAWQVFGAPNPQITARWKLGGEGDSLVAKRLRASHQKLAEAKPAAMPYQDGKLVTAQAAQASFEVQPGFCYIALAAGAPSLRSLDLEIVDQRGNIVAQALDQGSLARARVCADLKSRWTARLRAFKGYGDYGLQVFGGP